MPFLKGLKPLNEIAVTHVSNNSLRNIGGERYYR